MPLPLTLTPENELPLFDWLRARDAAIPPAAPAPEARVPSRLPAAGEQYRFHADMGKCIGCKCCVVACNEQNGNPAEINWRRVGEIEGGWYPDATRSYLSMGCNHCLEPTCLRGCPVDAYTKDPVTGIVRHSADACIGCQYCTWNCSYGVPQFNPERGVVGKCDMCHGRLAQGQSPACVSACPEGALQIEIVNVADWRGAIARGAAPDGVPDDDHSLSTTRLTVPEAMPPNARPRDITHVSPEHPHWPLVFMTVLTQLSVGAFATIWLLELLGAPRLGVAAIASFLVAQLALAASTFHLGRPVYAYRALRMWRRSWLSREVLLFSAFSAVASAYAAMLWLQIPGSTFIGTLTVLLGGAGVTASACIYRVPSRPAWDTPYTLLQFHLTALVLGPLFARAAGIGNARWLAIAAAGIASIQFVLLAARFFRLIAADGAELRGTARLLSTVLASRFVLRGLLLAAGAVALPLASSGWTLRLVALLLAVTGEIIGRYLFFVSVVPKHMAAPYLPAEREAA
ncbi:MAG TPA: DmsC/YnfH family molybdoenzyme membrane anchor subunit [Vicinamibacterales bacterium]|nr:DmsC/YnfH family molybdoenzyme membrane anchor subunit [Vicinamibacterales bacterium]